MLHRSLERNGESRMIEVREVLVPAHGQIRFAPGGDHLMLMHPRKTLHVGDTVTVDLRFRDGTSVTTEFRVRPARADEPGGH